MTAAEMGLDHNLEYFRMRVAELEESGGKFNIITDIIENQMQVYSDIMVKTHSTKEKEKYMERWHALKDLQKEIGERIGKGE